LGSIFLHLFHGHCFNQRQVHASAVGVPDHIRDLFIIEVFQRNGVQLDVQTSSQCGVYPFHHLVKVTPSRDLLKLGRIECIERNVDTPNSAVCQFVCEPGQLRTLCSQCLLIKPLTYLFAEFTHETHDVFTNQWLTTCQS
jgi:hypothetical protein